MKGLGLFGLGILFAIMTGAYIVAKADNLTILFSEILAGTMFLLAGIIEHAGSH